MPHILKFLAWVVVCLFACPVYALEKPEFFASNHEGYSTGIGVVTTEGLPGLFINPTSGTLAKHRLGAQLCVGIFEANNNNIIAYKPWIGFGITDWLEVGATGVLFDLDDNDNNQSELAVGPTARVRLLKDEGWLPELSVATVIRLANKRAFSKYTLVASSFKRFPVDLGILYAVRAHAGFRYFWQAAPNDPNAAIGFVGGELELPKNIFIVTETHLNRVNADTAWPWSAGMQVRQPDGVSLTLGVVQPGDQSQLGVLIGIGLNF